MVGPLFKKRNENPNLKFEDQVNELLPLNNRKKIKIFTRFKFRLHKERHTMCNLRY